MFRSLPVVLIVRHGSPQLQPVQLVVVVIVVELEVVELHGLLVVQLQLIRLVHVVLHVLTDVPAGIHYRVGSVVSTMDTT